MWGHFLPGKRYSLALSNHQIGNLRDGHELQQPKAAKADLWDAATSFSSLPRDVKNVTILGDADGFGGLTEVTIYPMCTLHSEGLWSLPL